MQCPHCGGQGEKCNYVTNMERTSAHYSGLHPPRNPHDAMLKLAWMGVSWAAKTALSQAYKCSKCDHIWRKWF